MRRALALMSIGAIASLCLFQLPVSASAPTPRTFVTMYSQQGDPIGQGTDRFFMPSLGRVSVTGDATYLSVIASGGTRGDAFVLTFAAPPGRTLKRRAYLNAQRAPFASAGRAGIDITGDGRGCNELTGRFDVRDIAVGASGEISRLWILYEQHCEGGPRALFGEVMYREPRVAQPFFAASANIWFPDTYVGAPSTVPINIVAARAGPGTTISDLRIRGRHPADYEVRVDTCTGVALAPGDICQILLRFAPVMAGPRTAQLVVENSAGIVQRIRLDGIGIAGTTSVSLVSDDWDWIGGGVDSSYDPSNALITVAGDWVHVSGGIDADNGDWWSFDFKAPVGDVLVPGTTFPATAYPGAGSGAGMSFTGNGRGCDSLSGTFTVNDLAVGPDDTVKHLSLDFEQHCHDQIPALHGEIRYRVLGPDATAPASPTGLNMSRDATGRRAQINWTNPGSDLSYVVVRYSIGGIAPILPTTQIFAYAGSGTAVSLEGLPAARPISVSVFPVDGAGSVGVPARLLEV